MSPITHLLISWSASNTLKFSRRDRFLIAMSGIVPDLDGLAIVGDFINRESTTTLKLWSAFHHTLCHNLLFCILFAVGVAVFAKRKIVTIVFAVICFHIHLFCDLIGSRGPDSYQWPIPYLWPFSDIFNLAWDGQWELTAWPNFFITVCMILLIFYIAWKRGHSVLEIVSKKADKIFVNTLRQRLNKTK